MSCPVLFSQAPFKEEAKRKEGEAKAMREEADRLESSNRAMSERFTAAQGDASRLLREKNALAQEVAELKMRLERAERVADDARSLSRSNGDSSARTRDLEVGRACCFMRSADADGPAFCSGAARGSERRDEQESSRHCAVQTDENPDAESGV